MNEEQRIKVLEEELKILKNEVKTILLDVREQYLNIQNPFNSNMVANTPPAGANPEQRPADEPEQPEPVASAVPAGTPGGNGSQPKPYAEQPAKVEIDAPGRPGMAPAPTDGQGQGAYCPPTLQPDTKPEDTGEEEEDLLKSRSPRSRRKAVPSTDVECEPDDRMEAAGLSEELDFKPFAPKNLKKKGATALTGARADLVVIAGLTQWVDQATGKLGKDRTEALVEMSTAMGRIPENIKDVLIRMVHISRYESTGAQSPTATDYLATLAQLESLMGGEQVRDNALLSMLSMMKESGRG